MGTTVVFGRLFNSPIHYPGKMTETIIRCKKLFHFFLKSITPQTDINLPIVPTSFSHVTSKVAILYLFETRLTLMDHASPF